MNKNLTVFLFTALTHTPVFLWYLVQHEHCGAYAACRTDILLPVVDLFERPQFKRKGSIFQYQELKVRRFLKNIV